MKKVKVYMGHPIRGPKGAKATAEDIEGNNKAARLMGAMVRELHPEIDLYVPGDQDQAITYLYLKGYDTAEQVLEADCSIIDTCDFVIFYNPFDELSRGMEIELDHCMHTSKAWLCMKTLDEANEHIKGLTTFYTEGGK